MSRTGAAAIAVVFLAGCSPWRAAPPRIAPAIQPPPPAVEDARPLDGIENVARQLVRRAETHRVAELTRRSLDHESLWTYLEPLLRSATAAVHVTEIGQSAEARPLYAVDFGTGPIRVMLWSQMHGDEPTATLALADLLRYMVENPGDPLVRRVHERLTVFAIPMLNPDGAERRRRENARGIDVNRDARRQASPEARALAAAHARFSPQFGFNLHDQAPRTMEDGRAVAISLLAPPHDEQGADMPTRTRAKRVAAVLRMAADSLVDGRVTRYEEPYNAEAFGDAMQSWATSTVLVETGTWEDDPDRDYLRQVNFALLLIALDAIATGSFEHADLSVYDTLPPNRARTGR